MVRPKYDEDQAGGYSTISTRIGEKFSKLTSWSRIMLEHDVQTQTPPRRIKSWYDGGAASGKWEMKFQKRILSGVSSVSLQHSNRVKISKRVARDVDLNRFDHIKDLRDREDALRECTNELRVTTAYSELLFDTSERVIEALQSQLDIAQSRLLKLSLSRVFSTENCLKKMFEIGNSKIAIRVNVGEKTEDPHWRHGVIVSANDPKILDVRVKGWPHIKRVSHENALIDGCWLNGVLENISISKYVLKRNLFVFSGLKSTSNERIREYCSCEGIMRSKKACEWDVVGFCDYGIRPLSVRYLFFSLRYIHHLR